MLLVGCGGGGQGPTSNTSTPEAGSPKGTQEIATQLKDSAEHIKRERKGQGQGQSPQTAVKPAPKPPGSEGQQAQAHPPAHPTDTHHDSGGGIAQFATKEGDNSIQETGHEGSASERAAAAAVLHAYLDARVAHRWSDACFYLSASMAATIEAFAERYGKGKAAMSCAEVLEALAAGSSPRALQAGAKADVGALRVEGDHGFVLYHGFGGEPYAMPMVLEGGDWKVGSVEATPLG
jgi:hypothetical protein